jgi:hypothetical protein
LVGHALVDLIGQLDQGTVDAQVLSRGEDGKVTVADRGTEVGLGLAEGEFGVLYIDVGGVKGRLDRKRSP